MKAAHNHVIEVATVKMGIQLTDLKLIIFCELFLCEEDTN